VGIGAGKPHKPGAFDFMELFSGWSNDTSPLLKIPEAQLEGQEAPRVN